MGDGNTLAINSNSNSSNGLHSVFKYKWQNENWVYIDRVIGEAPNDLFGSSIDLHYKGTVMICGASWSNKAGPIRSGFAKFMKSTQIGY